MKTPYMKSLTLINDIDVDNHKTLTVNNNFHVLTSYDLCIIASENLCTLQSFGMSKDIEKTRRR